MIYLDDCPITWKSKRTPIVTTGTASTAYVAMNFAAQELAFSSHLLSFLGFPQCEPMNLFSDNKPAVNAVLTSNTTPLTKHLDAHYHYVQELNVTKIIKAKWIERKFNESDIFT